jgi:DNA helicase-2/ATP-dependent DNA helicase PcrA
MAWNTGLTGPWLNIAAYAGTPLRVMAGPGTGKTFASLRKVARLLETGTLPTTILTVSFTRTAANDLVSQLQSLGSPGATSVEASTLHSLCFSVLSRNAVFQTTNRVARPLMDFEIDPMIADLASSFGGKTAVKNLLTAFEAYWATLQHHQPGWPQDSTQQHFQRELIKWLTYHEAMLIGELVPIALDYIRRNPASPHAPSYAHVIADEYQDLNRADQELIDVLARNGTLTVIGDEDQSIYTRLRHARPEGITQFDQTHANTHDEALSECKRCPTRVLEMANSLIFHNHPHRPSTIQSSTANGQGIVYIVQHNSIQDEVTTLGAFIDRYLNGHPDVKPGEVLFLVTRRVIGYRIRDELIALGRRARSFFTEQCLDRLVAQEGYCLLTLLVRPNDMAALRAWLGIDHTTARAPAYDRIWQSAQAKGVSPRQFIDDILAGQATAPLHTANLINRYKELSIRIAPLIGLAGTALIDLLWPPADPECADIRSIALTIANSVQAPADLLEELVNAIIQPELPNTQDDIIRVMSLHKSKGLTAKCVVVAGCVAGALPTLRSGLSTTERQQSMEEQRRLFYVAITRSTETLFLSSAATAPHGEAMQMGLTVTHARQGTAALQASPYWSELGPHAPHAISGQRWRSSLGF